MIVIDTNVISETWRAAPDARVLAWVDAQVVETLYLSAITIAELRFGIATMPAGRRRATLDDRLERSILPLFSGRMLPFDLGTSRAYAELNEPGQVVGTSNRQGRRLHRGDGHDPWFHGRHAEYQPL